MDQQQIFVETLEELKLIAKANNNTVTREDINTAFHNISLSKEQLSLVYGYLANGGITVSDVDDIERLSEQFETKTDTLDIDAKEQEAIDERMLEIRAQDEAFEKLFTEEMQEVPDCTADEFALAAKKYMDTRDDKAYNSLINYYMHNILQEIKTYAGKGVMLCDLLQEANLTIMSSLKSEEWMNTNIANNKTLAEAVIDTVKHRMEELISNQQSNSNINIKVLNRVNAVNDCAAKLKQELGRKATVKEVAMEMKISIDDVVEAIKLSAEKIEDIEALNN